MQDVELYRQLLGIEEPWQVESVDLSVPDQKVEVSVGHAKGIRWACPECGEELAVYDHSEERAWRHLDSCQFATWLRARAPRVNCPVHGVRQVALPWAEPHSRFTTMFERLAIDVLAEADVSGACAILRISWDEAWHILDKAVARGRARKTRRLPVLMGVDEKSFKKAAKYFTLVYDIEHSTVEWIAEDRKSSSLSDYLLAHDQEELAQIRAVAMDMWEPYIAAVKNHVPDANSTFRPQVSPDVLGECSETPMMSSQAPEIMKASSPIIEIAATYKPATSPLRSKAAPAISTT